MHTEHSFNKIYRFFRLNRCMHCNKIMNVLKRVYKCTDCPKVSHQSCLERNRYTIADGIWIRNQQKRKVRYQKPPENIKNNEFGELVEPNYLYNTLVIEKRYPISSMSKEYLKARCAEPKSLLYSIQVPTSNNDLRILSKIIIDIDR